MGTEIKAAAMLDPTRSASPFSYVDDGASRTLSGTLSSVAERVPGPTTHPPSVPHQDQ